MRPPAHERYAPMKVTRSLLATGAMAASAALLLGACAGEAETADPTTAPETPAASSTLTVWVDADRAGVLEDIAAQFEADRGVVSDRVTFCVCGGTTHITANAHPIFSDSAGEPGSIGDT